MNQTIFLLLGVLGLVGLGAAISGNDDDHAPDGPADDPRLNPDTVIGDEDSDQDQVLNGTSGDDGILGGSGDDTINGEAGDDLIGAGYGNDSVIADPGNDEIYLGGSDDVYGAYEAGVSQGNDTIYGGYGNDTITTNLGDNSIMGGEGDDQIYDYGGSVYINGQEENDLILSPDASDPNAPDTLIGGEGADTIHAGAGDLVDPGTGSDEIFLRSDAGGAADITIGGADHITVTLASDYTGEAAYQLVQSGEDVRLVVNGEDLAILRHTDVASVNTVTLVRETVS